MSYLGQLTLLWLLTVPPMCPALWAPVDTVTADTILASLERATSFLQKRLSEINLDGVVGFRVLEVQLKGIKEKWAQNPEMQPLNLRVEQLAARLADLLHKVTIHLEHSDAQYLREFQPTILPGFWKLPHFWAHTNASLVYPSFEMEDSFSEEHSDMCLVQLLGTGINSSGPCALSDFCDFLMTKPGCLGYGLSHQLLFFLLARMMGCTEGLLDQSQHYMDRFCANMLYMNRRVEAEGYPYIAWDIFCENIMFCGISGFLDFYKPRWLRAILSWQKTREGCFGLPDQEGPDPQHSQSQHHFRRRVKRRDKQFSDGCSSHNTAVAVSALGGFLYVLADHPQALGGLDPRAATQDY